MQEKGSVACFGPQLVENLQGSVWLRMVGLGVGSWDLGAGGTRLVASLHVVAGAMETESHQSSIFPEKHVSTRSMLPHQFRHDA